MPTKMTLTEAADVVTKLVREANIPGLRADCARELAANKMRERAEIGSGVYLYYGNPNIFAYECTLDIEFDRKKVSVNWSSTHRSPALARSCAKLFGEVADLACLIEAFFDSVELPKPY